MANLIGNAANQIPTNADLGNLAFRDVATVRVPASATAAGIQGQVAQDDSYFYVCTATNTWKRVAIATW